VTAALNYLEGEITRTAATISVGEVQFRVIGNKESLTHVLINLLSNALKFVAEGIKPQIQIFSTAHGNKVRVCIRDNGIGIVREHWDKIFEIFERLASSKRIDGSGVGLAIVKTAVERMGGKVGVESVPGTGSTFWFELPKASELAEATASSKAVGDGESR